ncbi:Ribosomal protein L23/L15e family protein [Salix suchowensis]|nr:Ribosomal protein L23/L15e family protein [Salix suchowensis]
MFGGGTGMGGGSGGGSMLRVVGRAVARAGVTNFQEPISNNTSSSHTTTTVTSPRATGTLNSFNNNNNNNNNNNLSLSSSGSVLNVPISANSGGPISTWWPSFTGSYPDDYEWVSVDGSEDERLVGFNDDFVLGSVPSMDEVQDAVTALTHVFDAPLYSQLIGDKSPCTVDKDLADQISSPTTLSRVSSVGSDIDWKEPSPALYNPRALHYYGPHTVHEAFHLLLTEPSVQKMVVSLSSDKAVWDAVLNNAAVQELRETFYADENTDPLTSESSDETGEESSPALDFVKWIFDNTRARVVEVIETVTKLVSELFKPPADEKTSAGAKDPFEYKLRISFLLSIMVLLIVVVTRAHKA